MDMISRHTLLTVKQKRPAGRKGSLTRLAHGVDALRLELVQRGQIPLGVRGRARPGGVVGRVEERGQDLRETCEVGLLEGGPPRGGVVGAPEVLGGLYLGGIRVEIWRWRVCVLSWVVVALP